MEQRFTLPNLPLHRELQAPVTIGTQFSVRATPIEHDKRIITLTLVTGSSEAALEITVHLPDKHGRGAKLRAISRSATAESSPLEKEVSTLSVNKELILGVIVKEHVFEIYLDTAFLLPFVHRINPSEITKIVLDGAMICNEVVIVPVKTDMPPLPQYNEVSLNHRPLQPTQAPAPPQPMPRAPPAGAVAVLPPYPAGTALPLPAAAPRPAAAGAAAASSIGKPPEPGWSAPAPAPPPRAAQMQQPQPVQPMQQAAVQQQPLPPPPPRIGSGAAPVPTTSAGVPSAPPAPYGSPQHVYPTIPGASAGPQFQNIQPIAGLSYPPGQQPPQQPGQQMQQVQQRQPMQPPQQQQPYPMQQQQPYPQYQSQQLQQNPSYYHTNPYAGQPYVQYPYQVGGLPQATYSSYATFPTTYRTDYCHYNAWHHHHC